MKVGNGSSLADVFTVSRVDRTRCLPTQCGCVCICLLREEVTESVTERDRLLDASYSTETVHRLSLSTHLRYSSHTLAVCVGVPLQRVRRERSERERCQSVTGRNLCERVCDCLLARSSSESESQRKRGRERDVTGATEAELKGEADEKRVCKLVKGRREREEGAGCVVEATSESRKLCRRDIE